MSVTDPRLTVRAFAELLALPLYEQVRILNEQKNPGEGPQAFKVPFYSPALRGIRTFYRTGNSAAALTSAKIELATLGLAARRKHNARVLSQFEKSAEASRRLTLAPQIQQKLSIGKLELRNQFDLQAVEGGAPRLIYYNFRTVAIDKGTAVTALELAHWVLEENGITIPIKRLQYVDLSGGTVVGTTSRRASTITKAKRNADLITTIWPTI